MLEDKKFLSRHGKKNVIYLYYYSEMIQITLVTCRYETKKKKTGIMRHKPRHSVQLLIFLYLSVPRLSQSQSTLYKSLRYTSSSPCSISSC